MTDLKEFLLLLETTVKASRLSSSKVSSLSDQSKKLDAGTDTEFVSTFLRLNKSLAKKSTNRISSLYVFDAIARANKGQAGREGLLLKMEGVVDSWVNGMCEDGKGGVWAEGRDKTRKIVDIWTKSSTFPSPCLDRLSARLTAASSTAPTPALSVPVLSPPKPVMSPALPPLEEKSKGTAPGTGTSTTPPVPPGSLPPEIQKLLGISAPQPNGATNTPLNAPTPTPAGSGGVDLAAILAGITKSPNPVPTTAPPLNARPEPSVNPLAGLKLDPNQLAALASLASHAQAPPLPVPQSALPYPPHQGQGSPPYQGQQYDRYAGGPGPSRRDSDQRYGFRSPSPPRGHPGRRFDDRPRSRSPRRYGSSDHGLGSGYDGAPRPGPGGYDDHRGPERPFDGSHHRQGSRDGEQYDRAPTYGQVRSSRDRRGRGRGRGGPPGGGRDEWDSRDRDGPQGSHRPPMDSGYARRPIPASIPDAGPSGGDTGRGRVALPVEPGKDEFGRDLPASAEKEGEDGEEDMALDESDDESKPGPNGSRPGPGPPNQQAGAPGTFQSQIPYSSNPPSHSRPSAPPSASNVGPTLETFDRTTFNPADPVAWSTLAQAWRASLGRDPNQMELMEWLATGVVGGFGAMMGQMGEGSGSMAGSTGGPGGSGGFQ